MANELKGHKFTVKKAMRNNCNIAYSKTLMEQEQKKRGEKWKPISSLQETINRSSSEEESMEMHNLGGRGKVRKPCKDVANFIRQTDRIREGRRDKGYRRNTRSK